MYKQVYKVINMTKIGKRIVKKHASKLTSQLQKAGNRTLSELELLRTDALNALSHANLYVS
jgi:hypothetical protein